MRLDRTAGALVAGLALAGCSTYMPQRYAVSADNNAALRGLAPAKIAVGAFAGPAEFDNHCRAAGPIAPPDGMTVEAYIRKALSDELQLAGLLGEAAPVTLTGTVNRVSFGSTMGLTRGAWDIDLTVRSSNGQSLAAVERYEFNSGFVADTACKQTAEALMPAVQDLIGKVVRSPRFPALVGPPSAEGPATSPPRSIEPPAAEPLAAEPEQPAPSDDFEVYSFEDVTSPEPAVAERLPAPPPLQQSRPVGVAEPTVRADGPRVLGAAPEAPPPPHLAPAVAPAGTAPDDFEARLRELVDPELRAFVDDPRAGCGSTSLAKAAMAAETVVDVGIEKRAGFDSMVFAGTLMLRVADAARKRECKAVAERLYDGVIERFVGSGYAALRQRAELGIRRL